MPQLELSDGVHLYYEDFGEGDPLVFVHGGAATHGVWEQQVYALADEFRTITYDHRGVGGSDKPRAGYTVDRLADDLYEIVQLLGLERVTLVSHGFGGHVVLRCLARHPEVAMRAALCAAAPWYLGDRSGAGGFSESFFAGLNDAISRNNPQANWDLFEHWLFHKDPGEPMKMACLQMALAWPVYVWKLLARDLPGADHRPYLPRITQDVLVMHGQHDRKNRYEGAAYLAENLPRAEMVTFADSAHCPFFEELEKFNALLGDFARTGKVT
jgi:pimeloyl-ACP methyl ester carboxylesterase